MRTLYRDFVLAKSATVGLLFAFSLAGQNPSATPPLVNLNLAVVDGRGQPVPGLRAEDFQVLDNGKPRKIVMLRPVHRKGTPATFILFDLFNADFAARGLSANEIVHTLEKLESADNVYLYLLSSTAKIFAIHGVTFSGARQETNEGPWTRRIKPMLDDALKQVNGLKSGNDRVSATAHRANVEGNVPRHLGACGSSGPEEFRLDHAGRPQRVLGAGTRVSPRYFAAAVFRG